MKRKHAISVLVILAAYFFWSYLVLKKDGIPQLYDASVCYSASELFFKRLSLDFRVIFSNFNYYPPLYMLLPLPFFKIFGLSQNTMALTNVVYLAILLFSLYKINEAINNSGLLSVVITLAFPVVAGYYRVTHLVTATTALVCLWLYFLLKTDNFTNRKYSLLCGAVLGLGMLESFHFMCYCIGPLLTYGILSFLSREDAKNKAQNLVYCILLSLVMTGLWYIPAFFIGNFKEIFSAQFNPRPDIAKFGFASRFLFNFYFIKRLILLPNAAVFLIFWAMSFFRRDKRQELLTIGLGSFLVSLCIISLFKLPPGTRYVLPILPSMGIIAAYGFKEILRNSKDSTVMLFGIFWFLFSMVCFQLKGEIPRNAFELLVSRLHYGILQSYASDPQSADLTRYLAEREGSREFTVVIIAENDLDPAAFSIELLREKMLSSGLNAKQYTAMSLCLNYPRQERAAYVSDVFREATYILHIKNKNDIITTRPEYDPLVNESLKKLSASCNKEFLRVFTDPDNFFPDEFYLYKKDVTSNVQ